MYMHRAPCNLPVSSNDTKCSITMIFFICDRKCKYFEQISMICNKIMDCAEICGNA